MYQGKILPNKYYGQQLKSNNKLIYNLSLISFGFTTASRIVDNNKSISYIIKYILPFGSSRSSSSGPSVYDILNDSQSLLPRSTVVYPSLCDDDNVLLNTPLYNYDTTSLLPIYDSSSEIALSLPSSLLRPLSNPPINLFDNRYFSQNLNIPSVYNFGLSLLPLVGVPSGVCGECTCFNLCLCLCLCPSVLFSAVIFSVSRPYYGLPLDMSYLRSSDFINRFFPVSIDDGLDPSLLPYAPAVRRYINSASICKPRKLSIDTPTLLKLAHNPDNEISILTDSLNSDLVEFIQPLSENNNEIVLFRNSIVKSKKEI